MQPSRATRALAALALVLTTLAVVAVGSASAATSAVTIIHGIPGPGTAVDIWVDGTLVAEGVTTGQTLDASLEAGPHDVGLYPAGTAPDEGDPLLFQSVDVPSGGDVDVIAHVNADEQPVMTVFANDRSTTDRDMGALTFRHAADAPPVDVLLGASTYIWNQMYAGQQTADVPAGTADVEIRVAPGGAVAADLGPITFAAGVHTTIYAIGSADSGTLDALVLHDVVGEGSMVRAIHGIPGGPAVDVYVDDVLVLEDVVPKAVSDPLPIDAGNRQVEVFAANADPASAVPIISRSVAVPMDADVTAIAHLDATATPTLTAFLDDLSTTPVGEGRLVVRHTADAPTVDIQLDGVDALTGLVTGDSASATVPAGSYAVTVQVAPNGPTALDIGQVDVPAGWTLFVHAVGSADAGTLDVVVVAVPVGEAFADVGITHPFHEEIMWMVAEGITTGYEDNTFRPGNPVTRQAFAAFLYRWSGSPAGDDPTCTSPPFPDVPVSHPFCGEIDWLADQDVTQGYQDGTFRPGAEITRQAMSAFFYRLAGAPQGPDPSCAAPPFPDVPVSHPFCGEIAWMADTGISTGYEDGTFRPGIAVSRQATAAFLFRFDMDMAPM